MGVGWKLWVITVVQRITRKKSRFLEERIRRSNMMKIKQQESQIEININKLLRRTMCLPVKRGYSRTENHLDLILGNSADLVDSVQQSSTSFITLYFKSPKDWECIVEIQKKKIPRPSSGPWPKDVIIHYYT